MCLAASVAVLGCGDGRQKMGVAKVEGTVTCDGQPIANVAVYFVPKRSGDNALTGKGGIGYCDDKGHFVVTTYDSDDGAVVGKHDVCVGSPLGGYAKPGFKCDCALNSELPVTEVEVVSGKQNTFELTLRKATKKDKMLAAQDAAKRKED
jgi:hypothetical protein